MPTILITGASRGLGLEFVRQYLKDGWQVHATARDIKKGPLAQLAKQNKKLALHALEVTDHAGINKLAKKLGGTAIDVVINNAGIFGPSGFDGKQQNFKSMDYDLWRQALEVNTLAPYKMAQAFAPHLQKGKQKCLVVISSTMGSHEYVKESGMVSTVYQSSKSALNMAAICLATELKAKKIAVLMLHPGWVQTDMGGKEAPLKPTDSIKGMRKVIANMNVKRSGDFRDYQGKAVAW